MSAIALKGVTKRYEAGEDAVAVDGIDLEVAEGEFVVLLGPTGCGKTTVLRIVAGLEEPTTGEVWLGGRRATYDQPRQRRIAMVFQDFALYPHLSIADNIAFPLRAEGLDDAAILRRVAEMAALVGVTDLLRRRPFQLSGGQRQRVAMARALARRPVALLLDEPLSNVDAAVRAGLRSEIVRIVHTLRLGTLYVTHDQTEAMTMADRIAVMRRGRIEQVGTPNDIYSDPRRLFVAAFVGTPRTSLLQAAVYATAGTEAVLDLGEQVIRLPWSDPRAQVLATHHTARVTIGLRTEALTVVDPDAERDPDSPERDAPVLRGRVTHVELLGNEAIATLDVGGVPPAPASSMLELPDAPGGLTEALSTPPAEQHGVDAVRGTLSRLVPHGHPTPPPATARTRYGFYPVYEEPTGQQHPTRGGGTVAIRVAMPGRLPRVGETLGVRVDLNRVFLFDQAGDRMSLTGPA